MVIIKKRGRVALLAEGVDRNGKKFGFALDVLTVASWQILIPLGVMGIWQLMSTIRIYVVVAAVLFSIVLDLVSDRKEAAQ